MLLERPWKLDAEVDHTKLSPVLPDPRRFYGSGDDRAAKPDAPAPTAAPTLATPEADAPSGGMPVRHFFRGFLIIGVMFFLLLAQGYQRMEPGTATFMKVLAAGCVLVFAGTFFIRRR